MSSPFASRSVPERAARLDHSEVACARERRLKEIQMWAIIREFFAYFFFLSLLFLLTYSNSNDNAFYQVQHLRNTFLDTRQRDRDFTKVSIPCTLQKTKHRYCDSVFIDRDDRPVLELAAEHAQQ
jgi:hypothetical protein